MMPSAVQHYVMYTRDIRAWFPKLCLLSGAFMPGHMFNYSCTEEYV
jgi:hypothetical protein